MDKKEVEAVESSTISWSKKLVGGAILVGVGVGVVPVSFLSFGLGLVGVPMPC